MPPPPSSVIYPPDASATLPTPDRTLDYFEKGEWVTNVGTSVLNDASSLISITSHNSSCVAKVFNENGQKQCISSTNPWSFFPFNPPANPPQSPCRMEERPQMVPNSASQEWIAERELEHFYFTFQDLLIRIKEKFLEAGITGRAIKEYFNDMVCGYAVSKKYKTLKDELSKLSENATVQVVFDVLLKFLQYDNLCLLKCVVSKFLPGGTASELVSTYESEFRGFQKWCPLGILADAHQNVYPSSSHHFSDTSISLHLDDNWQQHTYSHLEAFKEREINKHISEDSCRIVHLEKRSIFVVWEASQCVVDELSESFLDRFSHLESQGVLQLFIGRYELDFSNRRKPELYKFEPVLNEKHVPSSVSMMSLYSRQSCRTYDSRITDKSRSIDSGHYSSDTISKESNTMGLSPHDLLHVEVKFNYQNYADTFSIRKGEEVVIVHENDSLAYVMNEKKQYGYVPLSFLLKKSISPTASRRSMDSFTSFKEVDSQSLHHVDIIRHKIHEPSQVSESITLAESDIIVRPDTPPLVAQLEALRVYLPEDRNSTIMKVEQNMKITEIWPKQEKKLKYFLKDMETKSLSKSLRYDLENLKPDDEIPPSLFQRFKNYIRRPQRRKRDSSTASLSMQESQKLSPQSSIGNQLYTSFQHIENSLTLLPSLNSNTSFV